MNCSCRYLCLALCWAWLGASASAQQPKNASLTINLHDASERIDQLVADKLRSEKIDAHETISDEIFLRRTWLIIGGRIPTPTESRKFFESKDGNRRADLIEDLLHSEAYVSNYYHFWADILRINEGLDQARTAASDAYGLWLKQALRENMPYDDMVHRMITASDPWWEDGAVGYHVRDRGMPLDAMANTSRIFLGTRIECAQCHDHPFDKWTQMDFYKMAAFMYGIEPGLARDKRTNHVGFFQWHYATRSAEIKRAAGHETFPEIKSEAQLASYRKSDLYPKALKRLELTEEEFIAAARRGIQAMADHTKRYYRLRSVLDSLFRPVLSTAAVEVGGNLKLPHDYQYDDASPGDVVAPGTLFGDNPDSKLAEPKALGRVAAFADWLTAADNPRFTRVIVNRLWKQVFGVGIFEPVDELTDHTLISNPELLAFLEQLMIDLDHDMKAFLQVVLNSQTWQRAARVEPHVPGTPYHFPGPLMRRMTAEQVWDSIVALTIANADEVRPRLPYQLGRLKFQRDLLAHLESFEQEEFLSLLEKLTAALGENQARRDELANKILAARKAGDTRLADELQSRDYRYRRLAGHILWEIGWRNAGAIEREKSRKTPTKMNTTEPVELTRDQGIVRAPIPPDPPPPENLSDSDRRTLQQQNERARRAFRTLTLEMARASELDSPARRGHFLRDFGQSDRSEIENSADGASVPQALNLLNGQLAEGISNRYAVLGREVFTEPNHGRKIRLIFQGIMTRAPTDAELEIAASEFLQHDSEQASVNLIWSLLNTRQFLFVR